ncbi:hypothetical protein CBM2598_U10094 [Cupriavidus taiwanensis]|uniref:Uncharacterized protein n=1 Tax=Cupriavidus taiwanensis TaxID=164546 RepID=A0A7Z7JFR0_9BURK|nr:hypothetical protein CBM2597_U10257 [Cupriavidus taiwanensis]SOZ96273.1 hypothetical protein CBM2598_U10094 [Cupriavidus taiwanensis]SPC25762.1 hypothetical protein CBM2594_U10263 [Cupriavidus taiwanensis]
MLYRRALVGPVGAEHTAVALPGSKHRSAALALVEPLAGVGGIVSIWLWSQLGQVMVDFNSKVLIASPA